MERERGPALARSWPLGERERALILACVSRGYDRDNLAALVREPCDWNAVFLFSLWHKVAFLVYARLRESGALDVALLNGNLPLLLLNHWKQLAKVNEIRSSLYAVVAVDLCAAAELHGLDLVIAKGGVAMFGTVYTHFERKTYDVDFLSRRSQMGLLEEVFGTCGFQYGEYSHAQEVLRPPRPGDLRKHLFQGRGVPNFVRTQDGGVVDYLIAQVRFRIGASAATAHSISADPLLDDSVARDGIRVVSWRDLGLQLALHIHREAHEQEYRQWNLDGTLVKLCDFDRLLHSRCKGFVNEVVERARELGFEQELAFAAAATNLFLPSPLLAGVVDRCTQQQAPTFDASTVADQIWSTGSAFEGQRGAWFDIAGAKTT